MKLPFLDINISRNSTHEAHIGEINATRLQILIHFIAVNFPLFDFSKVLLSRSQIHQDLLALAFSSIHKGNPYFIDVGASSPEFFSNTYILERHFGWSGLLFESNPAHHQNIRDKRSAVLIENPVYEKSGVKMYLKTNSNAHLISCTTKRPFISHFINPANIKDSISLSSAFKMYDVPCNIAYLSIDIEGGELSALKGLNFDEYSFTFLTIEANTSSLRNEIKDYMSTKGYKNILSSISLFDTWYVPEDIYCHLILPGQ